MIQKTFNNDQFGEIRVFKKEGQEWLLGKDVADILEYNHTGHMTRILDSDEKRTIQIVDGTNGNPSHSVINESGLYHAVIKSRKPQAKAFRKWVTSEVLPQIRETGQYSIQEKNQFDLMRKMLDQLEKASEKADQALKASEQMKDAVAQPVIEHDRKYWNDTIKGIGFANQKSYSELYREAYSRLEQEQHVDLDIRLRNKKERAYNNGMSKSKIDKICKLDVIQDSQKLSNTFTKIVRDMHVKYK